MLKLGWKHFTFSAKSIDFYTRDYFLIVFLKAYLEVRCVGCALHLKSLEIRHYFFVMNPLLDWIHGWQRISSMSWSDPEVFVIISFFHFNLWFIFWFLGKCALRAILFCASFTNPTQSCSRFLIGCCFCLKAGQHLWDHKRMQKNFLMGKKKKNLFYNL